MRSKTAIKERAQETLCNSVLTVLTYKKKKERWSDLLAKHSKLSFFVTCLSASLRKPPRSQALLISLIQIKQAVKEKKSALHSSS